MLDRLANLCGFAYRKIEKDGEEYYEFSVPDHVNGNVVQHQIHYDWEQFDELMCDLSDITQWKAVKVDDGYQINTK